MKMSLLEMVQDILSSMDSDEVNGIDDTVESGQVATIIKNVYLSMASNRNWSGQKRLIAFGSSAALDKPTHLKSPDNLKELHTFSYNATKEMDGMEYRPIKYQDPDVFLRANSFRKHTDDNMKIVMDYGGTPLVIATNQTPTYWTSFDDTWIVCDSYDKDVDDTLKASKSQLHVTLLPSFRIENDFIPDMPIEAFQALLHEAKSVAFIELKQVANQKAEQESKRQQTWLSRKEWQLHGGVKYPNYGRRSSK